MTGAPGDDEPSLEIGPSGRLRWIIRLVFYVGIGVTVGVVLALLGVQRFEWPSSAWPLAQAAIFFALYLVVLLRTSVRVDRAGVSITGGPRVARGSWTWSELEEVSLVRQGPAWMLALRPTGSVWDVPGPHRPAMVQVPFPDRAAHEHAHDVLRDYCERHDVTFTEDADGLGSAPPGSPFRDQ